MISGGASQPLHFCDNRRQTQQKYIFLTWNMVTQLFEIKYHFKLLFFVFLVLQRTILIVCQWFFLSQIHFFTTAKAAILGLHTIYRHQNILRRPMGKRGGWAHNLHKWASNYPNLFIFFFIQVDSKENTENRNFIV